ncbi:MAG: hypothetical protein R3F31_13830 [Verrucomicrobiales bacterium]
MLTKLSDFLIHQPWAAAIPVVGLILLFKNMGRIRRVPWVQKVLVRFPWSDRSSGNLPPP